MYLTSKLIIFVENVWARLKLNMKLSSIVADYGNCDPYSLEACENAGKTLGLQLGGHGYPFSKNFATKGCYAYDSGKYQGMIFYGTGGSEDEMKLTPSRPKYRPQIFDCLGIGSILSNT